MSRPVVSTLLGAEGLEVTPGLDILLASTAQELANHVCSLLTDAELGKRLARAARHLVETKYDWRICLRGLESLYQAVLGGPPVARPASEIRVPGTEVSP